MSEDVLGYLHSKGIQTKKADRNNVHCACFFCGEDPKKRGRLYINVDSMADVPGLFFCHLCGTRGSLAKIKRHFGDPVKTSDERGNDFYVIQAAAAEYFHNALRKKLDVVKWLKEDRGLTAETIRHFKLGWADGRVVPHLENRGFSRDEITAAGLLTKKGYEFFQNVVTIPYYQSGTCVGIRQKDLGGKYKQPAGWRQRLFNPDALKPTPNEVVVTEGEFDCMIARQLGYAAVGVPGATQWQESWNTNFDGVKRIWVVFDNDDGGRNGAEKIQESLGPRVKVANIPAAPGALDPEQDGNDLSAWVVEQGHGSDDFAAHLVKSRSGLLATVHEAFSEYNEIQGKQGFKFNFEYLDKLIHPGLLPSQVAVVMAKTNTGKTLWLINMFQRMALIQPDLKFLFVSLEQTRGEWADRAMRIFGYYNLALAPKSLDKEEMERAQRVIQQQTIDFWSDRFMILDKNRIDEDTLNEAIDEYKAITGVVPDVVAVDYLGYFARGFTGSGRYERVSDAIMSLKSVAKEHHTAIVTPSQVNRMAEFGSEPDLDSARDSGAIEETADFAFVLWNPDNTKGLDPEHRTGLVHMKISKSRHGGKGETFKYRFAPQTLALVPADHIDEAAAALDELSYPPDGWLNALWRHYTGNRF